MFRSRSTLALGAFAAATLAATAWAQQTVDTEVGSCPRGGLSVYYARGESTPSEQAAILIARIGEEAARCRPEAIDLVADIDTNGDGEGAISLAMARLNNVAAGLVAEGVPAERIRIAAQARQAALPPMSEITVMFRQSDTKAGDAAAPADSRPAIVPADKV